MIRQQALVCPSGGRAFLEQGRRGKTLWTSLADVLHVDARCEVPREIGVSVWQRRLWIRSGRREKESKLAAADLWRQEKEDTAPDRTGLDLRDLGLGAGRRKGAVIVGG